MRQASGVLLSVLLLAVVGTMSGCGTSPPVRFFTLDSGTAAAAPEDGPALWIVVGPVTVPELVDRPQFVLRAGPNRVEIAEQARWAAPLKSEIARVVADHLRRLLGGARVATFGQRTAGTPDFRVVIDIQRFDTDPQEGATIRASWSGRSAEAEFVGSKLIHEPAAAGYDQLVAAHSRALAAVSRDIAAAIAAMHAGKLYRDGQTIRAPSQ